MSSIAENEMNSDSWDRPVSEEFTCYALCDGIMCSDSNGCKNQYRFKRPIKLNGVDHPAYCKKAAEVKIY